MKNSPTSNDHQPTTLTWAVGNNLALATVSPVLPIACGCGRVVKLLYMHPRSTQEALREHGVIFDPVGHEAGGYERTLSPFHHT